ncbi:hypothetical protein B0H19DRAFT_125549 [Mycena capillaripes]|nr:hypothetical protein B0H19DRAFT_125549 [Mycena capillaripes]
MPVFPQELLDIIVSELHTDVSSLRACALSFRAMVSSTQTHLFYTVALNQPSPPSASRIQRRSDCQKLSKILESAPHLASLIKDLRIVDDDPVRSTWVLTEWRTLSAMLSLFDLKRISVRCASASLDWDRLHQQLKVSLQAVFASPRLEAIQLHGVLLSAPEECALFHIFKDAQPSLQHLSFSYKLRGHSERPLLIPPVWTPKLRSLVIDADQVIDLLHSLSSPAMDYSRLRTLTLCGFNESEISELLLAIKDRNVLEDLHIYYPASVEHADPYGGPDGLKYLTNLRTIHFRVYCTLIPLELATLVGSCAANTALETIVLEAFVHNAAYYPDSDWVALAAATQELNKPVEVFLGEFGVEDPRPARLEVCFNMCFKAAKQAMAMTSSGLTIKRSTSYVALAEIYDGW